MTTILEALQELKNINEDKPSSYKLCKSLPSENIAHFTNTWESFLKIYNDCELKDAFNHGYISFEEEPGRIYKRYKQNNIKNKYNFGIGFKSKTILELIGEETTLKYLDKKDLTHYHDIYEKLKSSGIGITGVYKIQNSIEEAFILEPSSYDFRTVALIRSIYLYNKIANRMNSLNKCYPSPDGYFEKVTTTSPRVGAYLKNINSELEDKWNLIEGWRFTNKNVSRINLSCNDNYRKLENEFLSYFRFKTKSNDLETWQQSYNVLKNRCTKIIKQLIKLYNSKAKLWESMTQGYGDASNILVELLKIIKNRDVKNDKDIEDAVGILLSILSEHNRNLFSNYEEAFENLIEQLKKLKDDHRVKNHLAYSSEYDEHIQLINDLKNILDLIIEYFKEYKVIVDEIKNKTDYEGLAYRWKDIIWPLNTEKFESTILLGGKKEAPIFLRDRDAQALKTATNPETAQNIEKALQAILDSDFDEKELRLHYSRFKFSKADIDCVYIPKKYENKSEQDELEGFVEFIQDAESNYIKILYI